MTHIPAPFNQYPNVSALFIKIFKRIAILRAMLFFLFNYFFFKDHAGHAFNSSPSNGLAFNLNCRGHTSYPDQGLEGNKEVNSC